MEEISPGYTKIMQYIDHNPAAVLGTVDDDGRPHGAVVYIYTTSGRTVCFVTKSLTEKYKNIATHPQVSLTFYSERESSTLQAQGRAFIADNPNMIDYVLKKTADNHAIQAEWLPPVSKIQGGEYTVIGIELDNARLAEYQGTGMDGGTFTEL